jgi:hypothetical protein
MQAWQIAALVAAVIFPALGIINAYLLNQVRVELAAVRIQMLEARAQDAKEVRAWSELTFETRATADATTKALDTRLTSLESRRRFGDALSAH